MKRKYSLLHRLTYAMIFISLLVSNDKSLAQDSVYYRISFPEPEHHEADITMTFSASNDDTIIVRMSSSSPGRYAPHQFAKNIHDFRAYQNNQKLAVTRCAPEAWSVPVDSGPVKIEYTLFANHPDGTYSGFDSGFAILNIPSIFVWAEGNEELPISLKFNIPGELNWKAGTQLKFNGEDRSYLAPGLSYFMDSPVLLADFRELPFEITDLDGSVKSFKIALNADVSNNEGIAFVEMTRKFIREHIAVFGSLPSFDYGEYIFLCSYGPPYFGDGMEHRNSTMITSPNTLRGHEKSRIETLSHEFFHAWNVERLRPASLEPFDFTGPDMSSTLWYAEGFTSYYSILDLCRAGIYTTKDFIDEISSSLDYVMNAPGREAGGPAYMSRMAPFVDAGVWIDDMNVSNVFVNYYNYGLVTALGFDLMIRSQYKGLSLDDLMRRMWNKFGKPEIPYTGDDLENMLSEVTEDPDFARFVFDNYINDSQLPNYKNLLLKAGFILKERFPDQPFLGNPTLRFNDGKAGIYNYTLKGTPLYEAGLDKNDIINSIGGHSVISYDSLGAVLRKHKPGDTLAISYTHAGNNKTSIIVLGANPAIEIIPQEESGKKLPKKIAAFRNEWLGSKSEK